MCCPQTPEESVGSPGTGATEACEPPSECWEQNPGPLKEQLVPLTAEPSPQTLPPFKIYFFFFFICVYVNICQEFIGTGGGQGRVSDLVELELKAAVRSLTWRLGTKLWFYRTVYGLNL